MFNYFDIEEFDCSETGDNEMSHEFIHLLDELRELCGFPLAINSGYRSPLHSIERAKSRPGTHTEGIAADLAMTSSSQRHILIGHAYDLGFSGIGVAKTFIHVDTRDTTPVMWVY